MLNFLIFIYLLIFPFPNHAPIGPQVSYRLSPLDSTIEAERWTPELDSLAKATEAKYGLPANLCRAESWKESKHEPQAIRTEGNYTVGQSKMARLVRARSTAFSRKHHGIPSFLTEVFQEGSSHTRFQILGVNVRALGCTTPFLSDIPDSDAFAYFGKFYAPLFKRYDLYHAIGRYNGPRFPASYPREVLSLMEQFNGRN